MTLHSSHTIYAESFFARNATLFSPYLAAAGLNQEVLHTPGLEIPLSQYVELWEILGREVSPSIGLQVGLRTKCHELGVWGYAVRCAPTMQLALHCMSHFIEVLTQGCRIQVEMAGRSVGIVYQITDPLIIQCRQDAEFSVACGLSIIREITECANLSPVRVEFEHGAPADLSIYNELFECPVLFNQADNRLYFNEDFLDMPVRTSEHRLFQALEAFLEQQRIKRAGSSDLLHGLLRHIADSLSRGSPSIEQVAVTMNMGVRTLQRRLADHALDFSQLVEVVRRSLAENYVSRTDYSLTDIALLLGYTEASSFSRAFRRWMQITPQQYRQQARIEALSVGA
ncbi:AraC family transcriptional regulator [Pseudomonas sp. 008]|uniref:AraC-like transcriptional regulator QhpR n=1 Tax=Pseudomonas sp. 008 TaxID=2803906 RepID=UPI001950F8D7|nr:AraC family transcriptional regulator [Pseudomonas sp. 008]GID03280.1 AraC family transcriptional regulator [Pseudomonas sp. 008]